MSRVVDVFLYGGETDLAAARIAELDPVVDLFVALISPFTHQGDPVDEDALIASVEDARARAGSAATVAALVVPTDRFPKLAGRGGVGSREYQAIERPHRNAAADAIEQAEDLTGWTFTDQDVVLISDVDEIPSVAWVADTEAELVQAGRPYRVCAHRMHVWGPEWLYPGPWLGTTGTTLRHLRRVGAQTLRDARCDADLDEYRDLGGGFDLASLPGWHLTWQGGEDAAREKLASFSHAELADRADSIGDRIRDGVDINGTRLVRTPPRLVWPVYAYRDGFKLWRGWDRWEP